MSIDYGVTRLVKMISECVNIMILINDVRYHIVMIYDDYFYAYSLIARLSFYRYDITDKTFFDIHYTNLIV